LYQYVLLVTAPRCGTIFLRGVALSVVALAFSCWRCRAAHNGGNVLLLWWHLLRVPYRA